jgi:hypothetical protein
MNRLVIIGNGFDLAHGLPTSYKDFIDDYWRNVCDTKGTKTIINDDDCFVTVICRFGYQYNMSEYNAIDTLKSYDELKNFIGRNIQRKSGDFVMEFKNSFFKKISENLIENWVDLENEYYKELISIVKTSEPSVNRMRATDAKKKSMIKKLNVEFEQVKLLLEEYLIKKVEEDYVFSKDLVQEFMDIFNKSEYEGSDLDRFFMEISKKTEKKLFEEHKEHLDKNRPAGGYTYSEDIRHKINIENYFLSFNYTSTVSEYVKILNLNFDNLNEIHGRLGDERNLINFGFGDEMDKHYREIEEKDDNEYLRNIKSFQYLHTPNYRRLLNLIDSDKFQVYIMGHSCGLSDRTLLNTIFEHENCCSIKVFFHEVKDENNKVIKDNYTEITQNISRHFNKKSLMREKIVNKTICQPLPQVKLTKYIND